MADNFKTYDEISSLILMRIERLREIVERNIGHSDDPRLGSMRVIFSTLESVIHMDASEEFAGNCVEFAFRKNAEAAELN